MIFYDNRQSFRFGIGADPERGGGIWDGCSQQRNDVALKQIDRYLPGDEEHPALDVGCGNSLMRQMLVERYGEIETSDIDLDLYCYPYEWESRFRTVFSFEVLEHLLNPLHHLQELWRITKPGYNLYLTTPNDYSLVYKLQHLLSIRHPTHFHQFNIRDLREVFKHARWEIVEMRKYHRPDTGMISKISRNAIFVHATPSR